MWILRLGPLAHAARPVGAAVARLDAPPLTSSSEKGLAAGDGRRRHREAAAARVDDHREALTVQKDLHGIIGPGGTGERTHGLTMRLQAPQLLQTLHLHIIYTYI